MISEVAGAGVGAPAPVSVRSVFVAAHRERIGDRGERLRPQGLGLDRFKLQFFYTIIYICPAVPVSPLIGRD